ncbi:MAG: Uncharacterized protein G01um101431_96 [Parcubacteria group bacterium Gr01-1014_31]|nr:MAG: Uncharacterized protein G01um101431_96 [Parcubacteria group bacterium Gr01-1014_31]
MARIWSDADFTVDAVEKPHVTRTDGGHIVINPVTPVPDRTRLTPRLSIRLMRLTVVVGRAMSSALPARGIPIKRINYQDNGNWAQARGETPYLHVHCYGRATNAVIQRFGEALYFPRPESGFYQDNVPLNAGDIAALRKEILRLLELPEFSDRTWGLERA